VINFGSVFVARELERQRRLMRREQRQRLARERELESQRAFLYQVIDINLHLVFAKDREGASPSSTRPSPRSTARR
jgi:hypothetical protein